MSDYLTWIKELLDYFFTYGPFLVYLAIFAACFIENLAPPFPGDSFIVMAGGLVAAGRLDALPALVAVISGGLSSILIWFFLGRRYGRDFFLRRNWRFFTAEDIAAVEKKFQRHGGLLLIGSRFFVLIRLALAIAAGISRYPVGRMIGFTTVSYLLFSSLLMYLGFKLVENFDRVEYYLRNYNFVVWPVMVALIGLFVFRRIKRNRKEKVA